MLITGTFQQLFTEGKMNICEREVEVNIHQYSLSLR
jgi:hypothetical protein